MSWQTFIQAQLEQRKQNAAWRKRTCIDYSTGRELRINGENYLNFSGNDYLGLSHHPKVVEAWRQGAALYGTGSGGSGHITGFTRAHYDLENALSAWLGYPRALLFISGFAANQAVITALMGQGDRILADKLSHASILEASMLSKANLRRFAHNSPASLQKLLTSTLDAKTLVISEGVFSMDGDSAPLAELKQLAEQHHAWLMVDDAHGIGVRGREGRGSCDVHGIKPELLIVTFGKAFGLSGAAVLCDEATADYFIQAARHLIYSTSMPPAQAVALSAALQQIRTADDARERLNQHIEYFRKNSQFSDLQLADSQMAIQPVIVGDNEVSLQLSDYLRQKGLWVQAIRPPTVPPDSARLRITLSAAHHQQDIDQLLEALNGFTIK
ncbi:MULTISPECIES: 8-amino-7-oxononanoate synthase [Providencia]|uniref:8-amino-7-oxononanoate synthase n=1 Tax=Providencia TaxID=586 RepID=UPI000EF93919|nr:MULTISPECIES: 8-amino-7-oxononanoate synthase [Providencia]EMF0917054.1 8-amino-7-oxononanoate synthase [Providencia stuartii]MCR4079921.1 8-amino-7-oxononanoate synthase [Providencia stuartii]MTC20743.1 8-amino-7-oxononanoate synthase [Providencia stuartii]RMA14402.1 8-amino-7-oxononanoate synthase [Providencia stuartii]